ncbi:hypothetical protein ACFVH0_00580 [Streptomyces sp. NPDC127117]|uniref:hypothetical protein n=1 Tax=Streptomyces sp. NPDC127117 TaxID=3345368 RepID=UPI003638E6F7
MYTMQPRKKTTAEKAAPARKTHREEDHGREEAQCVLSGRLSGMVMVSLPRIGPMLATPGRLAAAAVENG